MFGFSIYCGLAIPNWVSQNPEKLQTGESCPSGPPPLDCHCCGWEAGRPLVPQTVTFVSFQGFSSWTRSSRCS